MKSEVSWKTGDIKCNHFVDQIGNITLADAVSDFLTLVRDAIDGKIMSGTIINSIEIKASTNRKKNTFLFEFKVR